MYAVTKWYGTFLINDDGTIERSVLFPKDAGELAARLKAISSNKILNEERELLKGYEDQESIVVANERLKNIFSVNVDLNENLTAPPPEEFGFDLGLLQQATLVRSRDQILEGIKPEKHIIHAINSINELTQSANLLSERLREWYGLHRPELADSVDESSFVRLILEHGSKGEIASSKGEQGGSSPEKPVPDTSNSLESDISSEDMEAIQNLARALQEIYIERERLEKYARNNVEKIAPNTSKIAGPLITAKLIAHTSGIERLARVSASTIQLLGAEKALFRHLKDGSSPPKHGVIFQHPYLHGSPYWQRGKIARTLASKISIAIKIDYYKGEYRGDTLEMELKARIEDIKKRHPKAPKREKKDLSTKRPKRKRKK